MAGEFSVRAAVAEDGAQMAEILNEIIAIGGTTARMDPATPQELVAEFLTGAEALGAVVAVTPEGFCVGFQGLERDDTLPDNVGDISTYARQVPRLRGVGTAMFAATRRRVGVMGLSEINAVIRADNVPGLAYYGKMGFVDVDRIIGRALPNGQIVDRIVRRFRL
ncbi:MAG: GNAT family N-acetyltransferase [Pseudomonadota bacterium]